MPNTLTHTSEHMSLRVPASEKALLMRAAVLQHTNLTDFMLRNTIPIAKKIIDENESVTLSYRDSIHFLDVLDNPPPPNETLIKAALDLPEGL